MLILLRRIQNIYGGAGGSASFGVTTPPAAGGSTGAGGYLNRRVAGIPVGIVQQAVNAAPVSLNLPICFWLASVLATSGPIGGRFDFERPIVLVPGGESALMQWATNASQGTITFVWDEVPFEP
jgi:hypothetical protein